ncbi:MAG: hypothetical protein ABSB88_08540 [Bryobacteraceae bacterium]|jgi:hypothetical protein
MQKMEQMFSAWSGAEPQNPIVCPLRIFPPAAGSAWAGHPVTIERHLAEGFVGMILKAQS